MRLLRPARLFCTARILSLVLAVAVLVITQSSPVSAKTIPATKLQTAQQDVPEDLLLDVGIQIFDPGLPPEYDGAFEKEGVFEDVRRAEARFMPVHLMDTLQSTGFWGAVRVVPKGAGQVDLLIKGKIVKSSGLLLQLEIEAEDARGFPWLKKKTYKAEAVARAYRDGATDEPFQHLYNHLANRLLKVRSKRTDDELLTIRQVTNLRFAADLAPAVFGDYLARDRKGRRVIRRLPAAGDPMVERVALIRERDYLFVDTLTEHYTGFQGQIMDPYISWRRYSHEEELTLKELKRQARTRKILGGMAILAAILAGDSNSDGGDAARDLAIYGGIYAIESGFGKAQEAKLHLESLRELAQSFDAEVAPVLVDIEGQTLRLSGSVETQFAEWRQLLRQMFAEETGMLLDPDDVALVLPDGGDGKNSSGAAGPEITDPEITDREITDPDFDPDAHNIP